MDKRISAQLIVSPLDSKDYLEDIKGVLKIIESSGLDYDIGVMSTVVVGVKEEVFRLIEKIYDFLDYCCGFTFSVNLSNICLACSRK